MSEIRIGTSGWIYSHWRGDFYPRELPVNRWFEHYQSHFDTVEINNTFYRLPPAGTFDSWRRQVHGNFLYAVKANRFLTHMKKLKDPAEPLERLFTHVRRLRKHLGPILYQLPPRWLPDGERLESFFRSLPKNLTHVMEFRDERCLTDDIRSLLARYNVGLCNPRHTAAASAVAHVERRLSALSRRRLRRHLSPRLPSTMGRLDSPDLVCRARCIRVFQQRHRWPCRAKCADA